MVLLCCLIYIQQMYNNNSNNNNSTTQIKTGKENLKYAVHSFCVCWGGGGGERVDQGTNRQVGQIYNWKDRQTEVQTAQR